MEEVFSNAINDFMFMVKPWELSKVEKKNLELSQQGNVGAFCDLLASQGLQSNPNFDGFFAWVNSLPEENTWGEKRAGSGRKPVADKKVFKTISISAIPEEIDIVKKMASDSNKTVSRFILDKILYNS